MYVHDVNLLSRQDDGRLLWYLSVPADPWEVPNGYLSLRGARVSSSEGALLRNNLREDEVDFRASHFCKRVFLFLFFVLGSFVSVVHTSIPTYIRSMCVVTPGIPTFVFACKFYETICTTFFLCLVFCHSLFFRLVCFILACRERRVVCPPSFSSFFSALIGKP